MGWVFITKEGSEWSTLYFLDFYFLLLKKIITSLKISEIIFSVSWSSIGLHQFILGEGLYKKKLLILKLSEMYFHITHYPLYENSWEKFPPDLTTKNRYNSSEKSVCFYLMGSELYNWSHSLHLAADRLSPYSIPTPVYVWVAMIRTFDSISV